jgi:hypothetical protein
MDLIDQKTDHELAQSLLAEVAKATNELRCAQGDVTKAQSRLQFAIVLLNKMIERQEIK